MVTVVQRARLPRGLAVAVVYLGFFVALSIVGLRPVGPDRRPGRARSSATCPALRRRRERVAGRPAGVARRPGHRRRDPGAGPDRARDAAGPGARGLGRGRRRSPATCCASVVEVSIQLILVLVLSIYMLLYGPRIGAARAVGHAAGRRDAGGRLPDARAEGGLGLRARAAPVQHDHGHERRRRAVDLRHARDLRRRARRTRWPSARSSG